MTFKKGIGLLHLWFGLASGLVVFVVSITGCLYAFQQEIQDALQDFRFVKQEQRTILPPSVFEAVARKELPNFHLHAINYPAKGRSVESIFYGFDPEHYYVIYHNPYTAKIIHVQNMNETFFRWVLNGHYYLWLPPEIGQPITSYATLIFVFLLITGIILWWPKNKAAARQRFWFRWKDATQWKRKNYDLHNIVGFYCSFLLLIIAVTGIFFGIQWFTYLVYKATGGEKSLLFTEPVSQKAIPTDFKKPATDLVWEKMRSEHPDAVSLEVHAIESDSAAIGANVNSREGVYWSIDYRYFDQYTLKEIPVTNVYGRLKDANTADKLIRMTYDIHTGGILGFAGKVLAFLLSLVAASLPVTGFLIWLGRRKKARKITSVSSARTKSHKSLTPMKITYQILLFTASLATTFSCTKEDTTQPVVPVQAQTVSNLAADPTTGVNPTTGQPLGTTGKYTLYNLRDNKAVVNTDSASNKWDIGFRGTSIIVNGGAIRSGQGGAYVHTGTFEELTTVPASATFAQDQTSGLAIPAVSGTGWYNYNSSTNIVTPIPGRVLVIRTGDGKYAKVEILSYYENAPATPTATSRSRFYTFRYAYQPDGSTKLN